MTFGVNTMFGKCILVSYVITRNFDTTIVISSKNKESYGERATVKISASKSYI
jgi:hypothetical protein